MALLRNYARLWTRSLRQFSTEIQASADLTNGVKEGVRMTPRMQRLYSDLPLNDRLRSNEQINSEGWITIRKELVAWSDSEITESTVDMAIVHLCLDHDKTEKAMEYLQHLWDGEQEMNLSSMTSYLKLSFTVGPNETQLKYLVNIYNKIREKYPVMDALTAECCIMAISKTDKWKESFELLEMIKLSCKPRSVPYAAIIEAAFNNDEPEIGFKYLREVLTRLNPNHNVYIAYLKYCTRNFKGEQLYEEISKMFELWGDQDVRPFVDVISQYEKVLEASGWTVGRTSIREMGVCWNCSHKLSSLHVTPEQFKKLTDTVRERVIIGHDVYRKTTPEELRKFLNFIQRAKPYDIVIDGLNVSYIAKTKVKPDGSQLANVVRTCVHMGKKILVLGRKHMMKWPKLDIKYIQEHGSIFLAENITADDPFLLYATLIRGPDTLFVSKDLMRQHKFLLEDPELTKTFKYWQMAHQMFPTATMSSRGMRVELKKPPSYLPLAQKDDNGWHVPFTTEPSLMPALVYEPPKSWVCFRKNPPNRSDSQQLS